MIEVISYISRIISLSVRLFANMMAGHVMLEVFGAFIIMLGGLGWAAQVRFEQGLARTVDWYRDNAWWWEPIRTGAYREYYERHYGRALKA